MKRGAAVEFRPDGWPLCPVCGEDELGDLRNLQASREGPLFCYRCGRHTLDRLVPIAAEHAWQYVGGGAPASPLPPDPRLVKYRGMGEP